ncbi:MAG: hypothetical protein VB980_05390 [Opitutales bacterium]
MLLSTVWFLCQMALWSEDSEKKNAFGSFQSWKQATLRTVNESNWPHMEIDRLLLAKLEKASLGPNQEVSGRSLAIEGWNGNPTGCGHSLTDAHGRVVREISI